MARGCGSQFQTALCGIRQQGKDFFVHRNSYVYLGTTFSAQRSRWSANGYPFLSRPAEIPWPDISWSATTRTCHDSSCINCFVYLRDHEEYSDPKAENFMRIGWLPEKGKIKTDLDLVVSITILLAKALWFFTFKGGPSWFGNFDRTCSFFLTAALTLFISPTGTWSIGDGFVFYPLRALCYLPKHEAPVTNKILDSLLTVMCSRETLTPVNSPAIANLCGTWLVSIWLTKGQADALQFANAVVRRILRPLSKAKHRYKDVPFEITMWLPSNSSRKTSGSDRSIDKFHVYQLDPGTHLRRLIEVIGRYPDLKGKKLIQDSIYCLPLDYCDAEVFQITVCSRYRFIYSSEKRPGLGHLLYLFQGETIGAFERIMSSDISRRQKIEDEDHENDEAQNDASTPPHLTLPVKVLEASENPTAQCNHRPWKFDQQTAELYYIVDLQSKPSFPLFGIEGS
ncbi:hypothetical protein DL98DRAFT_532599 [Cadophora sp. DSE1049]|nr:hypothetical protein DL98DRAFT_532599 [Cadophora sp. DSE1049]